MGKNGDVTLILGLLGLGYLLYKSRQAAEFIGTIPAGIATGKWASPYTQWKFFTPRGIAAWLTPSPIKGGYIAYGQE